MKIDTLLIGSPETIRDRAEALAATGVDGLFTFEGPHDVFLPLALASQTGCFTYTNIAVAFPRSPVHLAHTSWDLAQLNPAGFALGLGTQVRAHIERRYGATWTSPVEQMAEWIGAIRAVWASWQDGTPLDFRGEHTTHTLMGPAFSPGPLAKGPPPIWLGALGPRMTALAARAADGLLIHPFTSDAHLAEVTFPRITAALEGADRERAELTVVGQAIVSCGEDPTEQEAADEGARWLVGFYGSTPAYRPVLDAEGRGDLQPRLRALSLEGRWGDMAALIDDELLEAIVLRGDPDTVAHRLRSRFDGADPATKVDRIAFYAPGGISDQTLSAVVQRFKAA